MINFTYTAKRNGLVIHFGKGRLVSITERDGHFTAALQTAFGRCSIDELPQSKAAAKDYCEAYILENFAH